MIRFHINKETRKRRSDGSRNLVLCVRMDNVKRFITLDYTVHDRDWNSKQGCFRKSFDPCHSADHNAALQSLLRKALAIKTELEQSGDFDFEQFKARFMGFGVISSVKSPTLADVLERRVSYLTNAGRIGTMSVTATLARHISSFAGKKAPTLMEVDVSWLRRFEDYLRNQRHQNPNSISINMRELRRVINLSIGEKLLAPEAYPFKTKLSPNGYDVNEITRSGHIAVPNGYKSRGRVLSADELTRLAHFQAGGATISVKQGFAADLFMFSFYGRGMNFSDIAYLTFGNITSDDRIVYTRRKTRSGMLSIKILPEARAIIDKYRDVDLRRLLYYGRDREQDVDDTYLFPILSGDMGAMSAKHRIKTVLRDVSRQLKAIAETLQIKTHLTTYVARHTWATTAKNQHVPVGIISEALGHAEERTTRIYLESFDNDVIDAVNEQIAKATKPL
jgi:integrase